MHCIRWQPTCNIRRLDKMGAGTHAPSLFAGEDVCGICRCQFDGCPPDAKFPGDDAPVVWGTCTHAFHLQCINRYAMQCDFFMRDNTHPPSLCNETMCVEEYSIKHTFSINTGGCRANQSPGALSVEGSGSLSRPPLGTTMQPRARHEFHGAILHAAKV